MKRLCFILIGLVSVLSANAEGMVKWLDMLYDFGTFKEDSGHVTCQMRLVNIGDSALIITNVRPTCGCTASDYARRPVLPGDTATITLTYNPYGRPGKFHKDVYVYTNAIPRKSVVAIKGNVIGSESTIQSRYPIDAGPLKLDAKMVPFGPLKKGQSRTAFISGYNQSSVPVKVWFEGIPEHLRVAAVPEVVAPGELCTITTTFYTANKDEWGFTKDDFVLKSETVSGEAKSGSADIEVMAIINENFSKMSDRELAEAPVVALDNDKLDFGKMTEGVAHKELTLTNNGKSVMLIRRIFSRDQGVSAVCEQKELKPGKSCTIKVMVDPSKVAEQFVNGKIEIITNDPQSPNTFVRVVGMK